MLNEMVSYFKEFTHNWPLVTFTSSLVTFTLGLYVGHRTALLRDKRKEFNEVAKPIRLEQPERYLRCAKNLLRFVAPK